MWYDPYMPEQLPDGLIENAQNAVDSALRVRQFHRRRTEKSSPQREADIRLALARIKAAMRPLKTEIGRFSYGPASDTAEENRQRIRAASAALQAERRKLWKMSQSKGSST